MGGLLRLLLVLNPASPAGPPAHQHMVICLLAAGLAGSGQTWIISVSALNRFLAAALWVAASEHLDQQQQHTLYIWFYAANMLAYGLVWTALTTWIKHSYTLMDGFSGQQHSQHS